MPALFFRPLPFSTVWGGTSIKEYYGYDWMPDDTGQAWAFSAQERSNECLTAPYAGRTLAELWAAEPRLFGGDTARPFPVICSMLCPCDDLSIQVHPDDAHAAELGLPFGKDECWYFLDARPGASIVFGHNATSEADLRARIAAGQWEGLLRHLRVRTDDFVYLRSGTLHACGGGVIAYEVQRSADITYRFWDYGRVQADGTQRELHLEQAIATLSYDPARNVNAYAARVVAEGPWQLTYLHEGPEFTLAKLQVTDGAYELGGATYQLVSVVRGAGAVDGRPVAVGDHVLAPAGERLEVAGDLTCLMTTA